MGKTVLIYVLGTLSIFVMINGNLSNTVLDQSKSSYGYYAEVQVRDIGNTMIELLTSQLADSISYRVTQPASKSFFDGQVTYTVKDTVVAPDSMVKISVSATYFGQTKNMFCFRRHRIRNQRHCFLDLFHFKVVAVTGNINQNTRGAFYADIIQKRTCNGHFGRF